MWVRLIHFIRALSTGVIYPRTGNREAVELMDWEPNNPDCDIWFAKAAVIDLYQENRSRKVLIVQPEPHTTWCLPFHSWFAGDIHEPEEAFVRSVQLYLPNMEIPTGEVTAWQSLMCERSMFPTSPPGTKTEVTPCSYEWNEMGAIAIPVKPPSSSGEDAKEPSIQAVTPVAQPHHPPHLTG